VASALNIAALARRTGVQPDTLRKWEHRYGVIRPERTPGGQRRYTERDVARVEWLKARLEEGYRIGEAARLLGSTRLDTVPRSREELRTALERAVLRSEPEQLQVLVEHALAVDDVAPVLVEVIAPLLRSVGDAWASGRMSVAQEHLVSGIVRAHLERLLPDARGQVRGAAVLACAPGERHELGLLMLALLLRADGWQVAYLGTDTPVADAARLAADLDAGLLCFSATMPEHVAALAETLSSVSLGATTTLVLGGQAVTRDVARSVGVPHLNGDLPATVFALRPTA
jgi:methanogenic corrinoid protein MtbC1